MALIKCPDCGKMFSEYAESCPNCGCPTKDAKAANIANDSPFSQPTEEKESNEQAPSIIDEKSVEGKTELQQDLQPSTEEDESIVEEKNPNRKWLWGVGIMAVLIVGFIFVYNSFSLQKEIKEVESDSTQIETPKEQSQQSKEFLSTDWGTFELYGKVKSVTYNFDAPIKIQFDDFGRVNTISRNGLYAEIQRIYDGKISEIQWEGDWYHQLKYAYNNADFTYPPVPTNYTYTSKISGNDQTYILHYDDDNNLENFERISYHHGEAVGTETYQVTINEKDSHGNWIKRTCPYGDEVKVVTRDIVYYPENKGNSFSEPRTYSYKNVWEEEIDDDDGRVEASESVTIKFTTQSFVRIKYEVQDIYIWEGTYSIEGQTITMSVQEVYDSERKEVVTATLKGNKLIIGENHLYLPRELERKDVVETPSE